MFPIMLLGPSVAALVLARVVDRSEGWEELLRRLRQFPPAVWYLTVLIPPCFIALVLIGIKTLVSPVFAPGTFMAGIADSVNESQSIYHLQSTGLAARERGNGHCPHHLFVIDCPVPRCLCSPRHSILASFWSSP